MNHPKVISYKGQKYKLADSSNYKDSNILKAELDAYADYDLRHLDRIKVAVIETEKRLQSMEEKELLELRFSWNRILVDAALRKIADMYERQLEKISK